MIHLPYIPTPYPDEILGSWFARISLLSGRGIWRLLFQDSGFSKQIHTPFFDFVTYEERFEQMLVALGTGYEAAMMNLTTLPYWMAFDASDSGHELPFGAKHTPQLGSNKLIEKTGYH